MTEARPGLVRRALACLGILALYPLPHHALSRAMMHLARARTPWLKAWMIRRFIAAFGPDLQEARDPDPSTYPSFNAFFTRALRPEARPLPPSEDHRVLISPVDGTVSQAGGLEEDRLIQAKGDRYSLTDLFGGDEGRARPFVGGSFATLYLAPRDYHRIHMPLDGELEEMVYVPGRLYSVNATSVRQVSRLFTRNERVICHLRTRVGPVAVVLVGALFVGGIETVWAGEITPRSRRPHTWHYGASGEAAPRLSRGDELGRFNYGSTVILVLPPGTAELEASIREGARVRMGQALGRVTAESRG